MLLTWKEQFWDCNRQLRIVSLSIFERILKLQSSPNASYRALLYKTSPWEGLYHFWGIAFHGDWSYSGGISEIYFDQLDDIQTKSKWLKSCFSLGIMRVCCVLLIRLITMKETCNHLFFVCFFGKGWGRGEQVLGISEGVRHASNKDGFYIVHYNQADSVTKGLIWRQKWQAKLCLFGSPLFLIKRFCFVRFLFSPPYSPSHTWKDFAVASL